MGRRRTNLAWLIAVIAGIFMVVPTLASAQEQGSTEAEPTLTDEVTADEPTTTEDPATETPPVDPPADPVVPAEPTEPAPVEESTEPADSAGFDASADTSKAPAPEASSEPAPAPAPAAAPEPEPAEVAAVEAEATSSPGNGGGGSKATAGRAVARGGGDVEATVKSPESKPGCLARGGGGSDNDVVHGGFPDDGSCAQSLFENLNDLPTEADGVGDLETPLNGPNGPVQLDIWSTDGGDTVNATVLTGGPVGLSLYVKGGPLHNVCTDNSLANGETLSCFPVGGSFSHLDACVRPPTVVENPPPVVFVPPGVTTPPDEEEEVLTEEQQEQRDEQREQEVLEELEELEQAPTPVPTAVTPAPEEALPFTGLDTGWLVLLSIAMLGSGVLLRRKVS